MIDRISDALPDQTFLCLNVLCHLSPFLGKV
jgi:hypothetical protein